MESDRNDGGGEKFPPKVFQGYAWGACSVANGVLYCQVDTKLHVLDASNGNELTSFETGGTQAAGAPAVAGAVVGARRLAAVDAAPAVGAPADAGRRARAAPVRFAAARRPAVGLGARVAEPPADALAFLGCDTPAVRA